MRRMKLAVIRVGTVVLQEAVGIDRTNTVNGELGCGKGGVEAPL